MAEGIAPIREKLAHYIQHEIAFDRESKPIAPDEPLLNGIIDSTDILRLVAYLEEEFGVQMEDDDLIPENFETIESLSSYVVSKRKG